MVKVSIIIPIYNVEQYLRECLDSVVRQTLHELQIICINDGSTDGSLAILREYAARDVRITIVDKENGGYGMGMNIGLKNAVGEYIGIVEPDDYVPLDMFEDLYQAASENDLDFVKADFYRFTRNANGDMELICNHLSKEEKDYNVVFNPSKSPRTIRYTMNTWSGIYKRSFLEKNRIRHNESPGASFQDNGFYFQTFIYGKRAMILNRPYYRNRRDNPNSSVCDPAKVYCINAEYDYIREILMRDREIWDRFHGMYWVRKYDNYMTRLRYIDDSFKQEFLHRFAAELQRGLQQDELEKALFTPTQWTTIQEIVKDSDAYYEKRVVGGTKGRPLTREEKLERELEIVKSSESYRLGMALLAVPRRIKRIYKKK